MQRPHIPRQHHLLQLPLERKDRSHRDFDSGDDLLGDAEFAEFLGELVVEEGSRDGDSNDASDELEEGPKGGRLRDEVGGFAEGVGRGSKGDGNRRSRSAY